MTQLQPLFPLPKPIAAPGVPPWHPGMSTQGAGSEHSPQYKQALGALAPWL